MVRDQCEVKGLQIDRVISAWTCSDIPACWKGSHSLYLFSKWLGMEKKTNSENRKRLCCFSERDYALKPAVVQKRFIDFTLARHVMNCVYLMCAREVMSCNCTWSVHVWTWFTHAHQRFWLIYFDEIQASSWIKVIDLLVSDRCSTGEGGGGGDGLPKGQRMYFLLILQLIIGKS